MVQAFAGLSWQTIRLNMAARPVPGGASLLIKGIIVLYDGPLPGRE